VISDAPFEGEVRTFNLLCAVMTAGCNYKQAKTKTFDLTPAVWLTLTMPIAVQVLQLQW
jgi:hypothetical protein